MHVIYMVECIFGLPLVALGVRKPRKTRMPGKSWQRWGHKNNVKYLFP